ncbi:hypothetical protein CI1B_14770 [Bradyrhizobium ivorense]|uniref:Uncharacterized protein n=1 Tax=Bradyrhizobium ivorense TaxID=2511166 RepID=A0A508SWT2_9BRAD|nr:hypothetical protein CI1B_14770 [Bradyrhizobium ivorense]
MTARAVRSLAPLLRGEVRRSLTLDFPNRQPRSKWRMIVRAGR